MGRLGFAGWYFKHQQGEDTLAFIPGRAKSGAFVQLISTNGARYFAVPELTVTDGVIRAGDCLFSAAGCRIELPAISGRLVYGELTPLSSDIMGPFRHLPLQCRHGVLSMAHKVDGRVNVEGRLYDFERGHGYIESDSGSSFPRSYLWLQCNDFPEPCSIMAAIADIPLCGLRFRGCICAICYRGREYRLATYNGVRVLEAGGERLRLRQGKLLLELTMRPACAGHRLAAPQRGEMSGVIRESCNAALTLRLREGERTLIRLHSGHAAYEYMPVT